MERQFFEIVDEGGDLLCLDFEDVVVVIRLGYFVGEDFYDWKLGGYPALVLLQPIKKLIFEYADIFFS